MNRRRPSPPHPLASGTVRNWFRVARRFGREIDFAHYGTAASITAWTIGTIPLRLYEHVWYRRRVEQTKFSEPPVFVIGHWRSGTTNTQNLLLQDPQFSHLSLLHCAAPNGFLSIPKPLVQFVKNRLPMSRPMDAVPVGLDKPMSEEFAMVGCSDLTHYLGYFFPQIIDETFRRTILFDGVTDSEIRRWKQSYLWLLKKVTFENGGKRLLLKNPHHTGRLKHILEIFPDARFIHVIRNPYIVHASTCKLMHKMCDRFSLQQYDKSKLDDAVLQRHKLIMDRFFADQHIIPKGNLVEIRHEDLVEDQIPVLEDVYQRLGLPGFEAARPKITEYVESIGTYSNNHYDFDEAAISRVQKVLGPLADRWGYSAPRNTDSPGREINGANPLTVH